MNIPKRSRRSECISTSLSPEELEIFDSYCVQMGLTRSQILRFAIAPYIGIDFRSNVTKSEERFLDLIKETQNEADKQI